MNGKSTRANSELFVMSNKPRKPDENRSRSLLGVSTAYKLSFLHFTVYY